MVRQSSRISVIGASANTAAIVGMVAIVAMTMTAMLAVVAMVTIAMLIFGCVSVIALLIYAGMRYSQSRIDAQAALALMQHQLRVEIAKADTPELRAAFQADLDAAVNPRVALAMRRLTRAPLAGGQRTSTGFPRPTVT